MDAYKPLADKTTSSRLRVQDSHYLLTVVFSSVEMRARSNGQSVATGGSQLVKVKVLGTKKNIQPGSCEHRLMCTTIYVTCKIYSFKITSVPWRPSSL